MKNQNRKQLAKEYVQTHRPMGIYQIKNKVNGKLFLGGSMDMNGIFNRHKFNLNMNNHSNKKLQRDWREYGEANFSFEIVEQIKPREEILQSLDELNKYKDELELLEKMWFEELQPYGEQGYHKQKGGS